MLQHLFVGQPREGAEPHAEAPQSSFLLVDLSQLCDQQQGREEVNAEGSCREFGKALGKPLVRALKKLSLIGATLVAVGDVVQLALKLICCGALSSAAVARLVLVHPTLPAECVNNLLCSADPSTTPVDLSFDSAAAVNKRLAMIRCTFPCGSTRIASPQQRLECLASMLRHSDWRSGAAGIC